MRQAATIGRSAVAHDTTDGFFSLAYDDDPSVEDSANCKELDFSLCALATPAAAALAATAIAAAEAGSLSANSGGGGAE